MPLDINTLIAEYNGAAMSIAGHAEWGFIPADWFLAIPQGNVVPPDITINVTQFGAQLDPEKFIKANFHRVRAVAGSNEAALFVAMLRLHLVQKGVLAADTANRAVIEDEYSIQGFQGANWDAAENDIPNIPEERAIAKFIKHHRSTLVHQMVYVFSSRGHHWDPKYNDLYDRLRSACFITGNFGFNLPTNEVIYRLAIHCFGIKPLKELTVADKNTATMAAAMQLRFSPTAPIAGMAHITTLKAALDSMRQEPWWGVFQTKFDQAINHIEAEVVLVHTDTYRYHVAAKVFGYNERRMPSETAKQGFSGLCQFALGYIDHLGRRHSLAGQQAITQKSGGMRGLADAFSRACDRFSRPDTNVADMAAFLDQV